MQEAVPTFRVSSGYLQCLGQQAIYCGAGILVSWMLFLALSLLLKPTMPLDELTQLPLRLLSDSRLWMMPTTDEIRELIRFGIAPGFAACAALGGLADISSWLSVRYEFRADTLHMCWRRFERRVSWDLIQSVDERPHAKAILGSLMITQQGTGAILVRGLEEMAEFKERLRSQLPRLAKWTVNYGRLDLTGPATNFAFGFALILPLSATWIAGYVVGFQSMGLIWSVALLPVAYTLWFHSPMSRSHYCAREVEILMLILLLVLSCALTWISWLNSPLSIPFISRWFEW